MLKISVIELFFRLIPESLLFIFSGHALARRFVDKKKYILSSLLLAGIGYGIRLLPIHYGVHSILALVTFIIILVSVNKFDIIKAISSAIITMILAFISEGINILIIQNILHKNVKDIFSNNVLKLVYGIPSLFILAVIVGTYYIILFRRKGLK